MPVPDTRDRPSPALSRWARMLGVAAVALVMGMAVVGPGAVSAQIPDLFSTTTSTTRPGSPETTLLPPLEKLVPPPTTAPGGAPAPTLLPPPQPVPTLLPQPAPRTRTTTFTTAPTPPRTPLHSTAPARTAAPPPAAAPVPAEDAEVVEEEGEFAATLPFTPVDEAIAAAGLDVELGGEGGDDRLTMLASVAGGLIALVLLGVVGWVQSEVRNRLDVADSRRGGAEPDW